LQPHQIDPALYLNDVAGGATGGSSIAPPAETAAAAGYLPGFYDDEHDTNSKSTLPLPGSMTLSCEEEEPVAAAAAAAETTKSKTATAATLQAGRQQRGSNLKPPINHSTVEKQRRDRINSLIDELRELVPPQQQSDREAEQSNGVAAIQSSGPSSSESFRRPKHAVLADTIALVRDLRNQLAAVQIEVTQAQQTVPNVGNVPPGSSPSPPPERQVGAGPAAVAAAAAAAVAVAAGADSPFSTSAPGPEGVEIVPGKGCLYVKVHCRDRHGLLADIVRTLKAIPLEITTAAITTTAAGSVYDVFQVAPAPGTPQATAERIRESVIAAMSSSTPPIGLGTVSEKKRRAR
jgi:Helix-loop-helix DNA-binding domain